MAAKARSVWHRWGARGLVPVLALGLVLAFVGTAQAVHDTGFFQLDGNVDHLVQPAALNNTEDWDNICAAHPYTGTATTRQIGAFCQTAPGATLPSGSISDSSVFTQDGGNSDTDNIYKGGTDDADMSTWKWKSAKPSPPKDDILNAFAAQYTCDQAAVTGNKCASRYGPSTSAPQGHRFIFFGGDRYANNGNTNLGFWFLHNAAAPSGANSSGACPSNSGCPFSGTHTAGNISLGGSLHEGCNPNPDPANNICTPGDIFVFSAFLTGGSQPAINVYEWVGTDAQGHGLATNSPTSANTLQLAAGSGVNAAACDQSGTISGDKFCALVNQNALSSPWLFTDAASAANTIGQFELFEGGIDLTALGFGSECISTYLLNTRSSGSSVNSVAQDFSTGTLGGCESHVQTTAASNAGGVTISSANDSTNGKVSSGSDSATVTVTGVSQWGGTVDFYICGPIGATAKCDANGVKANGTIGNVGVTVSNSTPTVSSGTASLTSAGRYCWYSVFTPDTQTAAAGVASATDDGSGRTVTGKSDSNPECFTVSPVTPTVTTTAGSGPVDFGNQISDTATLSTVAKEPGSNGANTTYPTINATNGAFAGTITFTLYGPSSSGCGTQTANSTVSTDKNPSDSINVTGYVTYGPVYYTPGAPGVYHWKATYANASAINNSGLPYTDNSSCTETAENVTVRQIPTDLRTAQSWFPNDRAVIKSSVSGDNVQSGGTVDFLLYNDDSCGGGTGTLKYNERITLAAGDISGGVATVSTHNYQGATGFSNVPTKAAWAVYKIDTAVSDAAGTTVTYSWKVIYTPATSDTAHLGRQSSCTVAGGIEKFSTTYTNDNSGGVAP